MRASLRSAAVFLALALSARATAQAPLEIADVELAIPDCAAIPGSEIVRMVALELSPHARSGDARAGHTRAALRCVELHATVTVEDARRTTPLVLELDLSKTPAPARPRLLALAVAELIATSRLERAETAGPTQPPESAAAQATKLVQPPQPAALDSDAQPRSAGPGLELALEAGVARGFEPALYSPIVAIALTRSVPPFALLADLAVERGQAQTSAASITEQSVWLGLGPAWQARWHRFTLTLGPGVRSSYARLAASARSPSLTGHALSGFALMPFGQSQLQLRFARAWSLRVALELGYVLIPVRGLDADGRSLLELRGVRGAGFFGLAWSL